MTDREIYLLPVDGYFSENVPATQGDTSFTRLATTTVNATAWIATRPGVITSLWAKLGGTVIGGTCAVKLMKNTVAQTLGAGISFTSASPANAFLQTSAPASAGVAIVAGDLIEVAFNSSSLNPTTLDLRAGFEYVDS